MAMGSDAMFNRVLVANRGEIARRVIATLRRMSIGAAAVYSDADAGAAHVLDADVAVRIGPAAASQSYLRADAIIAAAIAVGADAVHPGYGFLSENAAFARACREAGLVFIGPPPEAIEAMGDKITAKTTVAAAGVRIVPGLARAGLSDDELAAGALEVGFPVMIKPSAGGGGKGMRVVSDPAEMSEALASARREAAGAFGDDTLFIERFIERPRHIEIQILVDHYGNAVHLGERECSLQRRHQKIVEEAPSPLLTATQRAEMGAQAVAAAMACGYRNAGTVEFIVSGDHPDDAYFMEMNTRLQVEHPVTELVWGIDLVEQQLRIAAGQPLGVEQIGLTPNGHAIEARLAAEDPSTGFLPAPGLLSGLRLAGQARPAPAETTPLHRGVIRVDAGVVAGQTVTSDYDPMIAKIIAHGRDRDAALATLQQALADTVVFGISSNTGFLGRLLAQPEVRAGTLDTELVERRVAALTAPHITAPSTAVVVAAAAVADALRADVLPADDPWARRDGWRLGEPAPVRWRARCGDEEIAVHLGATAAGREARLWRGDAVSAGADPVSMAIWVDRGQPLDDGLVRFRITVDGQRLDVIALQVGDLLWVAHGGDVFCFVAEGLAGDDHPSATERSGVLVSPMPGSVVAIGVDVGQEVSAGAAVVMIEAMKMEHTLRAPFDAVVVAVSVAVGDQVALGAVLVELAARDPQ